MAPRSLLESELRRYQRKGFGLLLAAALAWLYFVVLPKLLKEAYLTYVEMCGGAQGALVWGSYALDVFVLWGLFLVSIVVYRAKSQWVERNKIDNRPWPWDGNSKEWAGLLSRTWKSILFNLHILAPLSMYLDSLSGVVMRFDKESYPSTTEIVTQMVFFMLMDDFAFYFSHRLLHTSWLYARVHKQHHEYVATIAHAAIYAHPIEFMFGNMIPVGLGPKLLGSRVHIITYWLWIVLRDAETLDGHSGYEFSWSPFRLLPFSAGGEYHGFHHSRNMGNFGSFFTLWDSLLGTNVHYFDYLEKVK